MLFTTFLLATAVSAIAVQGAMLLSKKPDIKPTSIPYAFLSVVATIAGLIALGVGMN